MPSSTSPSSCHQSRSDKIWKYVLYGGVTFAIVSVSFAFGMIIWGMSMLSDSLNKSWDDQAELDFINQAHQQGYTDSQMLDPHCFGDSSHRWFGSCQKYVNEWAKQHNLPLLGGSNDK